VGWLRRPDRDDLDTNGVELDGSEINRRSSEGIPGGKIRWPPSSALRVGCPCGRSGTASPHVAFDGLLVVSISSFSPPPSSAAEPLTISSLTADRAFPVIIETAVTWTGIGHRRRVPLHVQVPGVRRVGLDCGPRLERVEYVDVVSADPWGLHHPGVGAECGVIEPI
jgi:hypothetical protein